MHHCQHLRIFKESRSFGLNRNNFDYYVLESKWYHSGFYFNKKEKDVFKISPLSRIFNFQCLRTFCTIVGGKCNKITNVASVLFIQNMIEFACFDLPPLDNWCVYIQQLIILDPYHPSMQKETPDFRITKIQLVYIFLI